MFNIASTLNKLRPHHGHEDNDHEAIGSVSAHSSRTAPQLESLAAVKMEQTYDMSPFLEGGRAFQMIMNDHGDVLHTNDALIKATGSADITSFAQLCHEDDRPAMRRHIKRAAQLAGQTSIIKRPPSFEGEARLVTNSLSTNVRWVRWHIAMHNGLTYISGADITREKELEKALSKASEQLVQAESIGRFGRWEWIMGQDRFTWSSELYRIFGLDPDHFTPEITSIYAMLHEDDQDRIDQTLQRAVINQTPFDVDFSFIRPSDGQQRFIRLEGRCKCDENESHNGGEVVMLYGIMQDISERVANMNDLRTAKEAAEKACAARTQFLANMSHELRTPLNAIIGFADMIKGEMLGALGVTKYKEYAGDISKSGAHLLDLISDILDMSKIEAGKYDLDREPVNMHDVINSAANMITPRANEKSITFTQDITFDEATTITGDRRACLQILLNILSNAMKFTQPHGAVILKGQAAKNSLTLTISDNGQGIPAAKLASITQPFEQVCNFDTRDHEGSGLGLAITKELIEMQGGNLRIKSQIGQGTDVIVMLPL